MILFHALCASRDSSGAFSGPSPWVTLRLAESPSSSSSTSVLCVGLTETQTPSVNLWLVVLPLPHSQVLVTGSRALLLRQWHWREPSCARTWRAVHTAPVATMAFDPTATLLATGTSQHCHGGGDPRDLLLLENFPWQRPPECSQERFTAPVACPVWGSVDFPRLSSGVHSQMFFFSQAAATAPLRSGI